MPPARRGQSWAAVAGSAAATGGFGGPQQRGVQERRQGQRADAAGGLAEERAALLEADLLKEVHMWSREL